MLRVQAMRGQLRFFPHRPGGPRQRPDQGSEDRGYRHRLSGGVPPLRRALLHSVSGVGHGDRAPRPGDHIPNPLQRLRHLRTPLPHRGHRDIRRHSPCVRPVRGRSPVRGPVHPGRHHLRTGGLGDRQPEALPGKRPADDARGQAGLFCRRRNRMPEKNVAGEREGS